MSHIYGECDVELCPRCKVHEQANAKKMTATVDGLDGPVFSTSRPDADPVFVFRSKMATASAPDEVRYFKTVDFAHRKNVSIQLIAVSEYFKGCADWARTYEVGDLIWIAGRHGYEGLLEDGEVLFHSPEILNLLQQLAAPSTDKEKL